MRVLGVLGGDALGFRPLSNWAAACDFVIAADAGVHHLEDAQIRPNLIVGDLDSISSLQDYDANLIIKDDDEHRSDIDKLFIAAKRYGASEVVLACIHGGRMDHFLASFSAAIATDLAVRWVLPEEHVILLRPGFHGRFSTGAVKRISLLPLEGEVLVSSIGLRWELDQTALRVGLRWSLSNESTQSAIQVQVYGGHLALMIENSPEEVPDW